MSVRFKNASVSKKILLNIRIQWNAGTAYMSECVLKTLACRGLRVGPSKAQREALHGAILFPPIVSYLSVCQSICLFWKCPHIAPLPPVQKRDAQHMLFFTGVHTPIFLIPKSIVLLRDICMYCSTQNYYRQTLILRAINFQLQIQNPAARRINFHYRNRSVGISAENLSLKIQILSWIPTNFQYRYRFQAQNKLIL